MPITKVNILPLEHREAGLDVRYVSDDVVTINRGDSVLAVFTHNVRLTSLVARANAILGWKHYEVWNRVIDSTAFLNGPSAQEVCESAGWMIGDCCVKEKILAEGTNGETES